MWYKRAKSKLNDSVKHPETVYLLCLTHVACRMSHVFVASCKRALNGLIATLRLSQESWMISTFLRQHATVACRANKPVYTARFCRTSHIASVLSPRVNTPLVPLVLVFPKTKVPENSDVMNSIISLPRRNASVDADMSIRFRWIKNGGIRKRISVDVASYSGYTLHID